VREKRDPIEHLGQKLVTQVWRAKTNSKAIDKDTRQIVNHAAEFAPKAPSPIPPNSIRTCWHDFFRATPPLPRMSWPRMRATQMVLHKKKNLTRRRGDAETRRSSAFSAAPRESSFAKRSKMSPGWPAFAGHDKWGCCLTRKFSCRAFSDDGGGQARQVAREGSDTVKSGDILAEIEPTRRRWSSRRRRSKIGKILVPEGTEA